MLKNKRQQCFIHFRIQVLIALFKFTNEEKKAEIFKFQVYECFVGLALNLNICVLCILCFLSYQYKKRD